MTDRIPLLPPGSLSEDQRALYNAIVGGPRAQGPQHFALTNDDGSLRGPFNALLLAPPLGAALQSVGTAIRYGGTLTAREREIAILIVATAWNSAFERESHEAVGTAAGLTADELIALRSGETSTFADEERIVAQVVSQLVRHDLDDETWQEASAALGAATIFELTTLVGYYATLALQLRVFGVDE